MQVNLHEERLDSSNAMRIFADYDLIVDGTDNFATRYLVNDACVLLGQALRLGLDLPLRRPGSRLLVRARPLLPLPLPGAPAAGHGAVVRRGRRARRAVRDASASIQVTEAIKLITGIGDPLVGRLMIYDALEMTYRTIKVRKDPECPLCGKNPTITELIDYEAFCGVVSDEAQQAAAGSTITASELKDMMDARRGLPARRRPRAGRVGDRRDPRRQC